MGQYAANIPDFEQEVTRIIDEVLFHPSELRDKLLAHVEQAARGLGLIPANTPGSTQPPAAPVDLGSSSAAPAGGGQAGPDALSAEQAATLAGNTGQTSEGVTTAPWRYDPVTGAPINQPSDPQPVTFGDPGAGGDQTGGLQSAVAGG